MIGCVARSSLHRHGWDDPMGANVTGWCGHDTTNKSGRDTAKETIRFVARHVSALPSHPAEIA
jgi:hypothetical protein